MIARYALQLQTKTCQVSLFKKRKEHMTHADESRQGGQRNLKHNYPLLGNQVRVQISPLMIPKPIPMLQN